MAQPPGTPYGPPPPGFPPFQPAPPPRGSARLVIVLVVAAAVFALVVAGAVGYLVLSGGDADGDDDLGPTDLRRPLTFQQVAAVTAPPCAAGTLPDAEPTPKKAPECFRTAPGGLTVRHVEAIKAAPPDAASGQTSWSVQLTLASADAAGFARLSGQAAQSAAGSPGQRIAMIVDGRVVSAPAVQGGPITGGEVSISGTFTQTEARDLLRLMTGRGTS
ncbi:hypothetical protein [Actinomadura sp. NEAU-AAG7]|uniref:SecDF P1 head subdomain-containing protein n=1 Tax=Actinomadura sp. NEAU-AAG7 TaxID=2839640 RepID=UPI001BE417BE|nr:hypothetical protein [Actinomadura sp. NEAU-AAG7]MBT2209947.1 hypothetical protein [Actinomadura sp. NEAU-AAG7]